MSMTSSQPLTADLDGRVAIVTGAAGMIGSATARVLAEAGARVVVADLNADGLERVVGEIRAAGGQAHGVAGDLAESADVDRLFAETERVFGPVAIQVNAAAMVWDTGGSPLDFEDERVDRILAINLRAPLLCSIRAARVMARHGGGVIVNFSSVGGSQRAHHHNPIYDACKGGIDGLTRAFATDLGPLGIRVNAIAPGATLAEPPEGRGLDLPLRRGGTPDDQAYAILYLVSDAARFVTGQVLYVDGGVSAQLRSPEGAPSSQ